MFITLGITLLLVILCVMIHYEALSIMRAIGQWLHKNHTLHRWHLSLQIGGLLIVHVIEVVLFALAYFSLVDTEGYNTIIGTAGPDFSECIYFSFVNFTTLGYGDLVPIGPMRFMAGMEALTGLVLITWTASFMYLQMQRVWKQDE